MSALPNAVAQAAAATACVPASVLQSLSEHSLVIRLLNSLVMLLAGGALAIGVLPSTRAASALVTVAVPGPLGNMPGVSVVPYTCGCSVTAALQY